MSCSLHNKSWWQPLVQRTASQGTLVFFEHCFHKGGKIPLGYSMLDTGHPGKHSGITPGCIFLCFGYFLSQKTTPGAFCTPICPMTSLPWKQCHLVVGHTLKYIVSKNEVNRTDGSRDIDIFVSPLSLKFLLFWPLSANTPETWLQIQHHNNLSPSLPRPLQMLLPVHWQRGQHQ